MSCLADMKLIKRSLNCRPGPRYTNWDATPKITPRGFNDLAGKFQKILKISGLIQILDKPDAGAVVGREVVRAEIAVRSSLELKHTCQAGVIVIIRIIIRSA